MLNSIVERDRLISPLSETEKKIIRSATKLFLKNGFSKTTLKMISDDTGIRQGTLCYHFHTKEDMLFMLVQELMDFHGRVIDDSLDMTDDKLLSYAMEITAQISLCETDARAWDLYYSAYTYPHIFAYIKKWTAKKNYRLLKEYLPEWDEAEFGFKETVASCIELSAFLSPCDSYFTLEKKITLILDSLMKLYHIKKEKRNSIIDKILSIDYVNIGKEMFEKFVERLDDGKQIDTN